MAVTFVENDTASSVQLTLTDQDGNVIDLTGASVAMQWQLNGGPVVTKAMTITSPSAGKVSYQFTQSGGVFDLGQTGNMNFKVVITFQNGQVLTSPKFSQIQIVKALV